ncbi:hypothetical protein EYF80_020294 [Liparis tanakae]|uniref:Uncharacterized protein n=1 Tax=Liparis tanakae TaxID=230148 RepID=A0A4Z2HV08_9TELE|nr:hypothetical protein EYF80_020294 [Liparis tanakae]
MLASLAPSPPPAAGWEAFLKPPIKRRNFCCCAELSNWACLAAIKIKPQPSHPQQRRCQTGQEEPDGVAFPSPFFHLSFSIFFTPTSSLGPHLPATQHHPQRKPHGDEEQPEVSKTHSAEMIPWTKARARPRAAKELPEGLVSPATSRLSRTPCTSRLEKQRAKRGPQKALRTTQSA